MSGINHVFYRPSPIACTLTTVYVTCTQTVLHVHENSYTVLISLCKNNLNLPTYSSFFCPVLGSLPVSLFFQNQFCNPPINQTSLSQSKSWFPLQISFNRSTGFEYKLYQQNFRIIPTLYSLKNYLIVINIG